MNLNCYKHIDSELYELNYMGINDSEVTVLYDCIDITQRYDVLCVTYLYNNKLLRKKIDLNKVYKYAVYNSDMALMFGEEILFQDLFRNEKEEGE